MDKNNNKTTYSGKPDCNTPHEEEFGFSTTEAIDRETFIGEISTKQRAFLEIIGPEKKGKHIELEKAEVTIGRGPDCEIQLLVENVSRRHARILYYNEEYLIEDLGSKNGIYINGIKVEKCILRKHDIIEIGGVKILFVEEKTRRDHERN